MSVIVVCNLKSRLFHSTLQNLTSYHIETPDNLQTVSVLVVLNYCFAMGDYGLSENQKTIFDRNKNKVFFIFWNVKILDLQFYFRLVFPTGGGRREEVTWFLFMFSLARFRLKFSWLKVFCSKISDTKSVGLFEVLFWTSFICGTTNEFCCCGHKLSA